jgi:LmbE family N-acetylglucosaminyl deacetylase
MASTGEALPVVAHPDDESLGLLNGEFGTAFVAARGVNVEVDRDWQLRAIRCHYSQANDNPVLRRRLALQGRRERLRLVEASTVTML